MRLIFRVTVILLIIVAAIIVTAVFINPLGSADEQGNDDTDIDRLIDRSNQLVDDLKFTRGVAQASITSLGVFKATRLIGVGVGLGIGFIGGAYLSLRREKGRRS